MQQSAISPESFCDLHPDRERVIVDVGGELDFAAEPQLAATIDELLDVGFGRIVVDLRPLTFLDSAAIHTLISTADSAQRRECSLSLVPGSSHDHGIFELTATDSLFDWGTA